MAGSSCIAQGTWLGALWQPRRVAWGRWEGGHTDTSLYCKYHHNYRIKRKLYPNRRKGKLRSMTEVAGGMLKLFRDVPDSVRVLLKDVSYKSQECPLHNKDPMTALVHDYPFSQGSTLRRLKNIWSQSRQARGHFESLCCFQTSLMEYSRLLSPIDQSVTISGLILHNNAARETSLFPLYRWGSWILKSWNYLLKISYY